MPRSDGAAYIWHVTLGSRHARRAYRDEINETVLILLQQQIAEMLAGLPVTLLRDLPEDLRAELPAAVRAGLGLSGATASGALLATLSHPLLGPLATLAVAPSGRSSADLWDELRIPAGGGGVARGDPPQPPWLAARLYPALGRDRATASWIGGVGPHLAWAWIERRRPEGGKR